MKIIYLAAITILLTACNNQELIIINNQQENPSTFSYTWTDPGQPSIDPLEDNIEGDNLSRILAEYLPEKNAYLFDGTTDQLSGRVMFSDGEGPFTASVWAFINSTQPGSFRRILAEERTSTNVTWTILTGSSSNLGSNMRTGGNACSGNADGYTTVAYNQIHHLLITYNGTHKLFYINNTLVDADLVGTVKCKANTPFDIGAASSSNSFYGEVSDVRLWNRSLNASEIATVYANGTVSKGLVAWYPFVNQSFVPPTDYSTLKIPVTPEPLGAPLGTFWADNVTGKGYIRNSTAWEALG